MPHLSEEQADHLEHAIIRAVSELFIADIGSDTSMKEARERADFAGRMAGRALAAALYTGEVDSQMLFAIRAGENNMRERFLSNATRLFGPGGEIRERFSKGQTEQQDD